MLSIKLFGILLTSTQRLSKHIKSSQIIQQSNYFYKILNSTK